VVYHVFNDAHLYTGLEINFDEEDYSTDEGDKVLTGISLSVRKTQAPFRMELVPVTVDMAETVYNLTAFLNLNDLSEDQKAQSGEIHGCTYIIFHSTSTACAHCFVMCMSMSTPCISELQHQNDVFVC